ncbi:MAG: hypothetical protein QF681_00310 [Vicinamibacterales bacterium]|nr:hypothetical protein [Vicinamibacterales bacterium]
MDTLPSCPRCGADADVEALGSSSGSRWLHCDLCGHLWRQLDLGQDAFSLIVAGQREFDRPSVERAGRQAIPRATRFTMRLEIRYRTRQDRDADWQVGHTENLSRTGVLFRTDTPLEQDTPLDLIIVLPSGVPGGPPSRFRCHGEIVRRLGSTRSGQAPAIAATVDGYRLTLR